VLIHAYKHAILMAESESRVEMSMFSRSPADVVAKRVLERPDIYRRWETEHARLLRPVSEQGRMPLQIVALRTAAFTLVHRRALRQPRLHQCAAHRAQQLRALQLELCVHPAPCREPDAR
jgi:hypothetical protein